MESKNQDIDDSATIKIMLCNGKTHLAKKIFTKGNFVIAKSGDLSIICRKISEDMYYEIRPYDILNAISALELAKPNTPKIMLGT